MGPVYIETPYIYIYIYMRDGMRTRWVPVAIHDITASIWRGMTDSN